MANKTVESGNKSIACRVVILDLPSDKASLDEATVFGAPKTFYGNGKTPNEAVGKVLADGFKPWGHTSDKVDSTTYEGSYIMRRGHIAVVVSPLDDQPGRDAVTGMKARPAWLKDIAVTGTTVVSGAIDF